KGGADSGHLFLFVGVRRVVMRLHRSPSTGSVVVMKTCLSGVHTIHRAEWGGGRLRQRNVEGPPFTSRPNHLFQRTGAGRVRPAPMRYSRVPVSYGPALVLYGRHFLVQSRFSPSMTIPWGAMQYPLTPPKHANFANAACF